MTRLKILITNDDGIHADGIKTLWHVLHQANFADLFVIAPATERSGCGVSISWDQPISIQKSPWPENTPAWAIGGTPADCIKMGERVILKIKPDLVVSGVNAGSNAGRNVLHSGTIGACIEAAFRGIPSIAFSCENSKNPNFHVAKKYILPLIRYVMDYPLSAGRLLNVNFPQVIDDEVVGFRLTRQGKGRWTEDPILHIDSEHGSSYWLGGKPEEEVKEEEDCDIAWLEKGYLTAVPLHVYDLTDSGELTERRLQFEKHFDLAKKG